ncbi:hypothetical protein AAFF_G00085130 [Aldrovandia affinis]|uniref:Uncharacterized protein n=1 Tax=Aldrovandia affinis TaxID=143900 RepID=A0AAD7R1N4_9TELE|nr:hypothetical protein AAFF_G00085130 [Aldrovandia affinis]
MFHHVLEDANVVSHHEFVHHLKRDLSEAAQIAQKNAIGSKTATPRSTTEVRSTINVYRIKDAVTGKERVVHRNMLLPVDFLTFPDQDGDGDLTSLGESRSNASCVSARTSVALDNQEDSQVRTMDWLMQSPVQAEAESASARRKMLSGRPYLWIPQRKTNQMSC